MLGRASSEPPHQMRPSASNSQNFSSEMRQYRPGGGLNVRPVGPSIVYSPFEYGLLANGSPASHGPRGSSSGLT